ncbi:MAG: hypothetical protein GEU74_11975 [Nitriliruptorales bacterium]|nr:hypothetical protein [Nitriliruptorales bacterium]
MLDRGVPPTASDHPPTWQFHFSIYHAEAREAWRAWLTAHHATIRGVWLASWKRATGRPAVPYEEAVEEALCFGWIDSTVNTLDEERGLQLMTPRRPRSGWTRLNRERVARLESAGRMTDAGRRAVTIAQQNGWWVLYDSVEDLVEPDDLAAALDEVPHARGQWNGFPPSARKQMLWSIVTAAKPETRTRRIAKIVAAAVEGRPAR